MRPRFELLDPALIERIVDEALAAARPARHQGRGARGDPRSSSPAAPPRTASGSRSRRRWSGGRWTPSRARSTSTTAPANPAVRYGQGVVHFDPGSSGVAVLDPETLDTRQSAGRGPRAAHARRGRAARVRRGLHGDRRATTSRPRSATCTGCSSCLLHSSKPVVTGAFTPRGSAVMIDLLALDAGGRGRPGRAAAGRVRRLPVAAPHLVRVRVPQRHGPGAGARPGRADLDAARRASPRRSRSSGPIVQHAAETLAGIVLHQLAERRGADRVGRRADDRRHADRLHADGRDRDRR